jgi:DNA-binding NarL/FixJ family response regulator
MTRLLIIKGQPSVLRGLTMLLNAQPDMRVVGEASDCEDAFDLATSLCPDVILVDLGILPVDGVAVVSTLHSACPQIPIIVLSLHDDALAQASAKDAGAEAFVAKSGPADSLLSTIRQVARLVNTPGGGQAHE